ncbi:hypothetical protein [Persephonella sp.]|uniref:hypothetical protein n=1 Tax=Persephonella sp. TaxID=2060922 RepID=UPI0025EE8ED9|nr:hypothetical protein [Persephonella sp.]
MKGKLKFQPVSKIKTTQTEECQKETENTSKLIENKEQHYIELPVYDLSIEQISLPNKYEPLNTKIKEVFVKQTTPILLDTFLTTKEVINPFQIPDTDLIEIHVTKEIPKIADVELFSAKIDQFPTFFNTNLVKGVQMDKNKTESSVSFFNLELENKNLLNQNLDLDTELTTTNIKSGVETLASSGGQDKLPIFEEFINCDRRLPRSFSESFNSPFIVLIGEDKYPWHVPIIYTLKELFCEITDKRPKVTFREPELIEEGIEEFVDSLDPHSLDQFAFEYKIEFLDARKMYFAVDEFVKMIKGRLKSGFLQQFGILVIAVKSKNLDKAKNSLKFEGLHVYTCKPDDEKYKTFCSNIFGVSPLDEFFNNLKKYEKYLDYTHRKFSIFVKRGSDANDKLQYPLKVATFVYLLNDLIKRKKRLINNFEELCKIINEILEDKIKVETPIQEGEGKVIPDLIYSREGKEIYVEIETLIGTFEPLKKIDETVGKYKDIPDATIWIVLKPVSAIIHYEELKIREKAYKTLYEGKKINFKVLTLLTSKGKFKWDLVNIDEFMRRKDVK